ncbi:MAG: hypothetical protein NTZ17_11700 [Phycisphaerae bacterium]|nr:hypothetical protein [Phycisphaerae bacterium]
MSYARDAVRTPEVSGPARASLLTPGEDMARMYGGFLGHHE